MQLIKVSYFCILFLFSTFSCCQEKTEIRALLLSKSENVFSSFSADSTSASFGFYISGYHIKAKRDSLANVQMIRRRDFPNVISNVSVNISEINAIGYWSLKRKNLSDIGNLFFITPDEYYRDWKKYYFTDKLIVIVPLQNKTFDIWECHRDTH